MKQDNRKIRNSWRRNDHHLHAPTQIVLVALSLAGVYLYGKFLLNPAHVGSLLPYLLAIFAEAFVLIQASINLWTILVGGNNPRNFDYHRSQANLLPSSYRDQLQRSANGAPLITPQRVPLQLNGKRVSVDVFVPTYHEPVETLRRTVTAARDMMGLHQTYILDDGKLPEVAELAKELGVHYITRSQHLHYKAGNINHALGITKGDLFVIFDADFVPLSHFLYETVPFFNDPSVAFVQTPQIYRNFDNIISRGAGYMQTLFYRLIMPGKNRFNAAFCVGTNVIFRRSSINRIGGMYTKSNSEDIWTALKLHEEGYKSIYIPDELAIGETPDTIKAYTKQQLRWATGGMEILLKHNPLFIRRLSIDQRLQYLATSSYYMLGLSTAMLMLLPPLHIFFNLSPVNLDVSFATWLGFYMSFYAMQIVTAFYAMNGFKLEVLLLATVSFPIYLRALWNAARGKEQKWSATGNRNDIDTPFNYIVPQILIFMFLAFTSVMGVVKYTQLDEASLGLIWNTINVIVFGCYIGIAVKEHRQLVKSKRTKQRRRIWVTRSLQQRSSEV